MQLEDITYSETEGRDADDCCSWFASNSRMRMSHYPVVCTGLVLTGFGGDENSYDSSCATNVDSLIEQIEAWIDAFETDYDLLARKKQFISACTTANQTEAAEALTACGFKRSSPAKNNKYGGKLYTWFRSINDDMGVEE